MVARRLAERRDRRPFWVATGFYLRAAGAATALACLVLVIQMARIKTSSPNPEPSSPQIATSIVPRASEEKPTGGSRETYPKVTPAGERKATLGVHPVRAQRHLPAVESESGLTGAIVAVTTQPRALLLVRNAGSEQEIAVPMVSVGAQPWVPVSFRPQDERVVRMAF
jgi:hypothetical protein